LQLEVARHLVRPVDALTLFSNHIYGVLAEKLDEVGRMIGGSIQETAETGARTALSARIGSDARKTRGQGCPRSVLESAMPSAFSEQKPTCLSG